MEYSVHIEGSGGHLTLLLRPPDSREQANGPLEVDANLASSKGVLRLKDYCLRTGLTSFRDALEGLLSGQSSDAALTTLDNAIVLSVKAVATGYMMRGRAKQHAGVFVRCATDDVTPQTSANESYKFTVSLGEASLRSATAHLSDFLGEVEAIAGGAK